MSDAYGIRPARAADAPALAGVHIDAWRTAYRGILSAQGLASLSYERREQWWRDALAAATERRNVVFVAETPAGEVVGFASAGPESSGDPAYRAELYAIYILEAHQGRGLGRGLMRAAVDGLVQAGHTTMLLWVLADNVTARRFYERLGGRVLRRRPIELFGVAVDEVAYGWDDLPALAAATARRELL
jgi:ribosomal protein S18 acetylase RimI-like enzyme